MGLGKVTEGGNATYLVVAGGYIWNKKADESDPNFKTQEWTNAKGEVNVRKGAQYANLTGKVSGVEFRTHDQYGEAIYVTITSGGDDYILNIKTNTANSQHMMKALLTMDLDKDILVNPYDFVTKDTKKRQQGLSFKQDGAKLEINSYELPKEWSRDKDFWAPSNKKTYLRYLEDLSDFFVGEIEEKIIPKLGGSEKPVEENRDTSFVDEAPKKEAVETREDVKITPLKMKKTLKEYIKENYEGNTLPELSKDELINWYNLSQNFEELPFGSSVQEDDEEEYDLDAELKELTGEA